MLSQTARQLSIATATLTLVVASSASAQEAAPPTAAMPQTAPQATPAAEAAPRRARPLPPAPSSGAPGYTTVQYGVASGADLDRNALLARENELLDAHSETGLGGPIALTAVGGALVFLGAYVWLLTEMSCDLETHTYPSSSSYNSSTGRYEDNAYYVEEPSWGCQNNEYWLLGSAAGAVMMGFGIPGIIGNLSERRRVNRELRQVRNQLKMTYPISGLQPRRAGELRLRVGRRRDGGMANLTLTF